MARLVKKMKETKEYQESIADIQVAFEQFYIVLTGQLKKQDKKNAQVADQKRRKEFRDSNKVWQRLQKQIEFIDDGIENYSDVPENDPRRLNYDKMVELQAALEGASSNPKALKKAEQEANLWLNTEYESDTLQENLQNNLIPIIEKIFKERYG